METTSPVLSSCSPRLCGIANAVKSAPSFSRCVVALFLASAWSARAEGTDSTSAVPGPVELQKVEVTASKQTLSNAIDRKIYRVGNEVARGGGSVSDLLGNIPSVQIDVSGNVSLRGSSAVLILIDGKPSALMSARDRADALAQMSGDTIDRIEVITNPSAAYKSEGTAGIINLITRKQNGSGVSGSLRASAGNESRWDSSMLGNYGSGPWSYFLGVNLRQDERDRYGYGDRQHLDTMSGGWIRTVQKGLEHMRPLARQVRAGGKYRIDKENTLSFSGSFQRRTFFRTATTSYLSTLADGTVSQDYDRLRADNEWQKTGAGSVEYQHTFAEAGHDLDVQLRTERHSEQEDNRYTNKYRTPVAPDTFDTTLIRPTDTQNELSVDYNRPFAGGAKLQSGYNGEVDTTDTFHGATAFDAVSAIYVVDPNRTNRFRSREAVHAFYSTLGDAIGRFHYLAGLRLELERRRTEQLTTGRSDNVRFDRLHPTLHLSYDLTPASQLQLNYSHRVRRPESDDLNPFPEYQDPYNLRAGNPLLLPEETHSIEAGYHYQEENTSYLAGVYFRDTKHAFTTVSRYLDALTLLTTQENLSSNRAGGLEFGATRDLTSTLSINASSNVFYSEIDASNLGYTAARTTWTWDAKLNVTWKVRTHDTLQLNANYTAKRLTAQGYRLPTEVVNLGWRHEFTPSIAGTFTISDIFDTLRETSIIDTPVLKDHASRWRNGRVFYLSVTYNFGSSSKKPKDEMQFDSSL